MLPRIHCITDFPSYDASTLDVLVGFVHAGVDGVQVRAKSLNDRELFGFTRSLVERLDGTAAAVIVNDRIDVALAAGAHGVHLGSHDLPVSAARRVAPEGLLVGATCRSADEARLARVQGADYAGVGPVYPTTTKAGLPTPVGLDVLRAAARILPVVAVSGIDEQRTPEVMATGAHGVAVAAALCHAPDPPLAARRVVDAVTGR